MPHATSNGTKIYYELHGEGIPLFLQPVSATPSDALGDLGKMIRTGYLEKLTDRYEVLLVDYPSSGKSDPIPARELTADRVTKDLLVVADAAGFDKFCWWGFSWGGVVGLQLATSSDRLSALVCGGWPPLGAPYSEMLQLSTAIAENPPDGIPAASSDALKQWVTYYSSIQDWPERQAVGAISSPRLTFVGSDDEMEVAGIKVRIAATIRDHRKELKELGWRVEEIPGRNHQVTIDPDAVVPLVRSFLDDVT